MIRFVAALLAGLVLGGVVAVATRGQERSGDVPAHGDAPFRPGLDRGRVVRGARVVARVADPAGGPPWVVRTFLRELPEVTERCAQLGRSVDGAFGWFDPRSGFRAVRTLRGAPVSCLEDYAPLAAVARLVQPDVRGEASATVTWGRVAADVARVEPDGSPPLVAGRGVVLAVAAGGDTAPLAGSVVRRDGRRSAIRRDRLPRQGRDRIFAAHGRETKVAVRAADPAGGIPWGVLVAPDGCLSQPDRVLGETIGLIDPALGTLSPSNFGFAQPSCYDPTRRPTARAPVALEVGAYGGGEEDRTGTVQLRRLAGRTTLSAAVLPRVTAVTLITPRNQRTLVPSPVGRAILAVYDGNLAGKRVRTIARFADGHEVRQSFRG